MKKNKLILFDWGNIVESHKTGYNLTNAFTDLFKSLGCLDTSNLIPRLAIYNFSTITSLASLEDTYTKIKKDFNLNGTFSEFLNNYQYYFNKIDYYKEVRDFEISLKNKCYIGIFSNLLILDKERLDKEVGLENYDYVFLSYEFGYRKPDLKLYNLVQAKLPFSKEDILFIDDRLDNVEAALAFGWKSYQLSGLELAKIKKVCYDFISEEL